VAVDAAVVGRPTGNPGQLGRWLHSPWPYRALSLTILLGCWQLFGNRFSTSFPLDIARALPHSLPHDVVPAFGDTLKGFGAGYAVSMLVGIPLGLLMARSRVVELALEPYVAALYASPRLALIPVLILWLGINFNMRFAVVVMSGIFPIILNTYFGAKEVDHNLLDAGRAFNANALQSLRTIVVPGSLPYIFAGLRLGMARAFIGIIVAEIETSVLGIGNLISSDVRSLQFADMWVAIISLGVFSIIFTTLLKMLERWSTIPWERKKWRASFWPLRP
jgi:ABC-type nitrate/sulfonate/bicarbonate transport system permease component